MFQQSPFSGESLYAVFEVFALIGGSLVLGVLLGYLIWGWTKRKLKELGSSNSELEHRIIDLKQSNSELRERISQIEASAAELKADNNRLQQQLETLEIESVSSNDTLSDSAISGQMSALEGPGSIPDLPASLTGSSGTEGEESMRVINDPHLPSAGGKSDMYRYDQGFQAIYGIDDTTARALVNAGIENLDQLRHAPKSLLKLILERAGTDKRGKKMKTWSRQAEMAIRGEWKRLKAYHEFLKKQ